MNKEKRKYKKLIIIITVTTILITCLAAIITLSVVFSKNNTQYSGTQIEGDLGYFDEDYVAPNDDLSDIFGTTAPNYTDKTNSLSNNNSQVNVQNDIKQEYYNDLKTKANKKNLLVQEKKEQTFKKNFSQSNEWLPGYYD